MKQRMEKCFKDGWDAEKRFINSYLTHIKYPTKQQDIYEHWDVQGVCIKISDKELKFDIKSSGKLREFNHKKPLKEVWVEGKNISGNDGWLRGKADYIAFEREQTWFIVNRKDLLELTITKLKENNYKTGKGIYLISTRRGRKDKITQVPFTDMETIEHYQLLKRN